jgi:hypothetical protein
MSTFGRPVGGSRPANSAASFASRPTRASMSTNAAALMPSTRSWLPSPATSPA